MIYDCFMFHNELDILELRLNTLNDIVDKFVIVEARKTITSNQPKEPFYEKYKERFKNFHSKIIHIIIDEFPAIDENWQKEVDYPILQEWCNESFQRNAIAQGLSNCMDDDIIMISDVDEIPNPQKVLEVKDLPGLKALDMNYFVYSLNNLVVGMDSCHATKILSYKDFKHYLDDIKLNSVCAPDVVNKGTTATKIRLYFGKKEKVFHNSGWHFTFLGTEEDVVNKLKNYQHSYEFEGNTVEEKAKNAYYSKTYFKYRTKAVTVNEDFPEYLYKNQDKFAQYIRPANSRDKLSNLAKKSKPKTYLRLPIKLLIQLIPNKKLKGDVRNYLCQKAQLYYL